MEVTQQYLQDKFSYNDGQLFYKNPISRRNKIGDPVGWKDGKGYLKVGIGRRYYSVHALVFCMHTGILPTYVDHVDGNILNNRIENLRECTHAENMRNARLKTSNTSGYKGVSWDKVKKKWGIRIRAEGKYKFFGYFEDKHAAAAEADRCRKLHHGEFAHNGYKIL